MPHAGARPRNPRFLTLLRGHPMKTKTKPGGGYFALVKHLRDECGYTGSLKIEEVEAFVKDNELELNITGAKNLRDLHAKTVYIKADAGEEIVMDKGDEPETEMVEEEDDAKAADEEMDDQKSVAAQRKKVLSTTNRSAASGVAGRTTAAIKNYNARVERHLASGQKRPSFSSGELAWAFGAWFKMRFAAQHPSRVGAGFITEDDKAIYADVTGQKAQTSYTNAGGAAIVAPVFIPDIIELFEEFGVARRVVGTTTMTSDTAIMPRRTNNYVVYQPGQNNATTVSNLTFDNVELVAKEWLTLGIQPLSLIEDSTINIGDTVGRSVVYAFTEQEDQCFFNGDGTSEYFGFQGVINRINSVVSNKSLITGSGNSWSALTLADFEKVVGELPQFPGADGRARWVASRPFYFQVMKRLENAAGGTTPNDIRTNGNVATFLGYPVEVSQVMPKTTATGTVACLFGDFASGAKFGDRRSLEVVESDQRYFEYAQLAVRGRQRVAVTVHDFGSATEAGPILALKTS